MYNGFQVIQATIHDVPDIYRINLRAFRQWKDQWSRRWFESLLRDTTIQWLVAREGFGDHSVVGYLATNHSNVLSIAVEVPRRGIGKSLLHTYLASLTPGHQLTTVIRHKNVASISLFTGAGFVREPGRHRTWGTYTR